MAEENDRWDREEKPAGDHNGNGVHYEEFIFIWNDSQTIAEVMQRTGGSYRACLVRAQRYRKIGYDMKCFTAKREYQRLTDWHHEEKHIGINNAPRSAKSRFLDSQVDLLAREIKCHYCRATFRENYYRQRHERDFHGEKHG